MNVATVGPGARLKLERERRGLSLQKAADEMRLDPWAIEALEAEHYERVGPAVYGKGHLKRYASILGISWDDIAAGYELRASPSEVPPPPTSMRVPTAAPAGDRLPRWQIAALVLPLLGVAGVLSWWKPWQPRVNVASATTAGADAEMPAARVAAEGAAGTNGVTGNNGITGTNGTTSTNDVTGPDEITGTNEVTGSNEVPGTEAINGTNGSSGGQSARVSKSPTPSGPSSTPPATPAAAAADTLSGHGSANLRLRFSAQSWVDVHDARGKRIYSGYGQANSVKTIAGEGPLRVYLGYASGVQIEINNHAVAIGTAFLHGDVARFQAGADGILRSFSGNERPPG